MKDGARKILQPRDEMRTSGGGSGDQAECNHYCHVLSESQLTVICASCGFADDNGPMALITQHTQSGASDLQSCAVRGFPPV